MERSKRPRMFPREDSMLLFQQLCVFGSLDLFQNDFCLLKKQKRWPSLVLFCLNQAKLSIYLYTLVHSRSYLYLYEIYLSPVEFFFPSKLVYHVLEELLTLVI